MYAPGNDGLPFGSHPHRGFETVTFIVQGELTHKDSGGHESVIRAGGVQWMTAGRGLVHAEVSSREFKDRGGPLEILQLWVNLPARLKMAQPRYVGLQAAGIPAIPTSDARGTVHLIPGEWNGRRGPVESLTGVFMSTVALRAGGGARFPGVGGPHGIPLRGARAHADRRGRGARACARRALGDRPRFPLGGTASVPPKGKWGLSPIFS